MVEILAMRRYTHHESEVCFLKGKALFFLTTLFPLQKCFLFHGYD